MNQQTIRATFLVLLMAGCAGRTTIDEPAQASLMNSLSSAERAGGWRLLFDGASTSGWRGYKKQAMPSGWAVVDGALARVSQAEDIITVDQFGNFELALEWNVAPGGNSGIFYRATEGEDVIYKSAPEMQVLDDERHADGRSPLTSAGAIYGLYPAPRGVVKPAGQWNAARVIVNGNHVEHWLNGTKVGETEMFGRDWSQRVANSKFKEWPAYARSSRGHIGLQEHGGWVAFRNIKIRPLP